MIYILRGLIACHISIGHAVEGHTAYIYLRIVATQFSVEPKKEMSLV
jgi:hypothetical protein